MKTAFVLLFAFTSFSALAQNVSQYTSVAQADCRVTESSEWKKNPEIDYMTMFCPGLAGYKVKISGGDLRYPLSLMVGRHEVTLTQIPSFHELASTKIEWRGPAGERPNALIYRLSVSNEDGKNSSVLYVVRLKGRQSCVIGEVLPSADMNERARTVADNLSARCL